MSSEPGYNTFVVEQPQPQFPEFTCDKHGDGFHAGIEAVFPEHKALYCPQCFAEMIRANCCELKPKEVKPE